MSSAENNKSFNGFPPCGSTLCPMCDYDLRGLPTTYQCPECAFEYDDHAMMWELNQADHSRFDKVRLWVSLLCCAFAFIALADMMGEITISDDPELSPTMFFNMLLVSVIAMYSIFRRKLRAWITGIEYRMPYVFVGSQGIITRKWDTVMRIKWQQVFRVRVSFSHRIPEIDVHHFEVQGDKIRQVKLNLRRLYLVRDQVHQLIRLINFYRKSGRFEFKIDNFENKGQQLIEILGGEKVHGHRRDPSLLGSRRNGPAKEER